MAKKLKQDNTEAKAKSAPRSINDLIAIFRARYKSGDYSGSNGAMNEIVVHYGTYASELTATDLINGAWSYYRAGNYPKIEPLLTTLRKNGLATDETDLLDALNAFEFCEYTRCLELGNALLKKINSNASSSAQKQITPQMQAILLNRVALSLHNLGNHDLALEALTDAVALDNNLPETFINLATIRERTGDKEGKRQAISEGLVFCSDKSDLEKLATEFLGEETISLCMIVKNEEEMLAQCLQSVKGLVNEIIVVDTGSTDRTVEIAKSYGAKVYIHPWEKNFSLHRNQSINYATCDWILIMDADEELVVEDHAKLKKATRIPDMNVISISVHNKHLRTGDITSFLPSVRLWRRKIKAYYEGIVHNELRFSTQEPILRADVRLIHYGYGLDWDKMKQKIARSKELLQQQLDENPNNAFANFNYAQLLRGEYKSLPEESCRQIIQYSGRAVAHTNPEVPGQRHIHLMALDQMVSAHFFLREYDTAEKLAQRALELEPHYLDALFSLGHIYAGRRDFARAVAAYKEYIRSADNYDSGSETQNLILIHSADQGTAYFSLGLIYEELKQPADAVHYFEKVLDYKNDHLDLFTHLASLHYNKNSYDKAEYYARKRMESDPNDLTVILIAAEIARRKGKNSEARNYCHTIIEHDPSQKNALEMLVAIEREAGQLEEALRLCDLIMTAQNPSYYALENKGAIFMTQQKFPEARQMYEKMAALFPNDAEVENNLGNCYFKISDFRNAISHYVRALSNKPQLVVALRNLGFTYFKVGEKQNAAAKLSNYLDYVPDDFDILYLVSRLYFECANYSAATRYLEKCLSLQPFSSELICFLGDCYLKQGHLESARLGYQKALKIDPTAVHALEMIDQIDTMLKVSRSDSRKFVTRSDT